MRSSIPSLPRLQGRAELEENVRGEMAQTQLQEMGGPIVAAVGGTAREQQDGTVASGYRQVIPVELVLLHDVILGLPHIRAS